MQSAIMIVLGLLYMCWTHSALAGETRASLRSGRPVFSSPPPSAYTPAHRSPVRIGSRHRTTIVILPYSAAYILPPEAIITSPYFCLYHNEAFVSRVGMVDHLAGMHNLPLTTAASICQDANGSCVFPAP